MIDSMTLAKESKENFALDCCELVAKLKTIFGDSYFPSKINFDEMVPSEIEHLTRRTRRILYTSATGSFAEANQEKIFLLKALKEIE
jgi:hypothetical protein